MAEIFFSWSKPDESRARPLCMHLKGLFSDVFHYEDNMKPGDKINSTVLDAINSAKIAVICISNLSAQREWIVRELNWAIAAQKAPDRPMIAVIPIRVGELDESARPPLLRDLDLYIDDQSGFTHHRHGISRLVSVICKYLNQPQPHNILVTIAAMNSDQYDELLHDSENFAGYVTLCRQFGLEWTHDTNSPIRHRYGDSALSLRPFRGDITILQHLKAVESLCNNPNEMSIMAEHSPALNRISISLYDLNDLISATADYQEICDLWRTNRCLIIVDQLSLMHSIVSQNLGSLFQIAAGSERQALLVLPPYSRHITGLPDAIRRTVEHSPRLNAAWRDWSQRLYPMVAFDIGTEPAFTRWCAEAFNTCLGSSRPSKTTRDLMNTLSGLAPRSLSSLLRYDEGSRR